MTKIFNNKGFTIVEALIVAGIFGTVGMIAADLLARSFQGSNKVKLVSSIKQNGQSALNSIEQTIRYADSIICPINSNLSSTIVVVSNGVYSRIKIADKDQVPGSYIAQDHPSPSVANDVSLCDSNLSSPSYLISQSSATIDTGSGFVVNNVSGKNKSVNIKFSLSSNSTSTSFDNQITPVNFQTTIQLR